MSKKLQASNNPDKYALIDDDVFETIQEMGLKFSIQPNRYFRSTTEIQLPGMTEKKRLLLHVFVFTLKTGELPNKTVDHIDINPLNNQFENLRLATQQEQQHNHRKRKDNSSGFIGVSHHHNVNKYNKKYDYWRASIRKPDGKNEAKYFPFTDEGKLAAARLYDAKAKQYFGEFAVLNFPNDN